MNTSPGHTLESEPPAPAEGTRLDFTALLLGTAVGDALGLPAEGFSPHRIRRRWKGVWKMRLCFGYGMISDDTDHAAMTAECLTSHPHDAASFARALGRAMRWWLLALPPGTGLATARACLRLWCGVPSSRSGVFSAGNGPAMRAAVIGLFHAHDADMRRAFIEASTRITHTDSKACAAAMAVAESAAWIARPERAATAGELLPVLRGLSSESAWLNAIDGIGSHLATGADTAEYATALGLARGVSGYAFHSVPVALYGWLRHRSDFRRALTSVLDCGGDTDSTGAITGALAALETGVAGIPDEWLSRVADWPRSIRHLRLLGGIVASGQPARRRMLLWPFFLLRNLFQLLVILCHGLRRLIPL
jgi:ADP-ribosyl-[dinitrogen reductase] hydrolase